MLIFIGVVLFALLGVTVVLTQSSDLSTQASAPPTLTALEVELERPFILYVDGDVSPAFRQALTEIDAPVGALADVPPLRTLLDLDVYVMVRDSWDVFRGLQDHDLATLIRQHASAQAPGASVAWLDAGLSSADGAQKNVLVVLAAKDALAEISDFCFALTIHDLARYARNGVRFVDASDGPGSYWKQCRAQGWSAVADIPG